MAGKKKLCRIVYYEPNCGLATLFKSPEKAEAAAVEYGKAHGYECEAVRCERPHTSRGGQDIGVGWHVRGVRFH